MTPRLSAPLPDRPRVVSDLPLTRSQQERITAAMGPCSLRLLDGDAELPAALDQADVAFLTPKVSAETLIARPHLRWVHINLSGLERFARPELVNGGPLITGVAGRSAPVLAEHALMFMLAHVYRLGALMAAQQSGDWAPEILAGRRGLFGRSLGIIGLGETGQALAGLGGALNMRVLGYNRTMREIAAVDRFYCGEKGDTIAPLLAQSDFVVLCLALTDATRNLIGADEIAAMKSTACLINIGRGALIREEALIAALEAGQLAGAGLDVLRQEPLPKDSPLWLVPNLMITPHVTPGMPDGLARSVDIIVDNIARLRQGLPPRNALGAANLLT